MAHLGPTIRQPTTCRRQEATPDLAKLRWSLLVAKLLCLWVHPQASLLQACLAELRLNQESLCATLFGLVSPVLPAAASLHGLASTQEYPLKGSVLSA